MKMSNGLQLLEPRWIRDQNGELDMLKVAILHDTIGKEVHMTQPVGFVVTDSVLVAWAWWSSFGWTTCGLIPLGMGT